MKKLILFPFLVFGQFLTHAQKPTKKAQQIITLQLMPAGRVHLPKIKKDKGKGNDNKDIKQQLKEALELSSNKNVFIDKQVIETVVEEKKPDAAASTGRKNEEPAIAVKNRSVVYTISSL